MHLVQYRHAGLLRTVAVLILFFSTFRESPGSTFQQDTIIKVPKGSLIQIKDIKSFASADTVIVIPASLKRINQPRNDNTLTFYDSLKAKMSKTILTKALYDLVIINPDTANINKITEKSDESFEGFSGLKIRNIGIQRLNVFGTNVDNPGNLNSSGIERVLNSTHVNTAEHIIRKNLIFREGDSISVLKLTDNERILRQLPYIEDARIIVVPVSENEADILVITKDVYSLGADLAFRSKNKGSVWLFEKNVFGMGHEFRVEIPYSGGSPDSPGIGLGYYINNIKKSFINLNLNYYNGLGRRTYGFSLYRNLISSDTKYSGGITISQTHTTEDLDTLPKPEPLKFNYQDYWLQRSFMINRVSVTRIIAGIRFINDNIYQRPRIDPDTYYSFQKKALLLGSVAYSRQKYYKATLIYSYGRTEDIPAGSLFRITGGVERNEFKKRVYLATDAAIGGSVPSIGYFRLSAGFGTFVKDKSTEQGVLSVNMNYFSNLLSLGRQRIRNFVNIDYTRGFDRYEDEYLSIPGDNGFDGFKNDSLRGGQRVRLGLESVVFTSLNFYGFRFAVFGFADFALLSGTNQVLSNGTFLTGLGLGLRIRNDNLAISTIQIRLGYFPGTPLYSNVNYLVVSGEQLLHPKNFEPGPPALIPYR